MQIVRNSAGECQRKPQTLVHKPALTSPSLPPSQNLRPFVV